MDNIFGVFKEKVSSPFLSNYFIGVLIFNRKVIYAALTVDYHERIGNCYYYHQKCFDSKIELLEDIYLNNSWCLCNDNFCLPPCFSLFVYPILYSSIITGALPFIKAVFKTLNERALIWYTKLKKKYAKIEIVTKEEFNDLQDKYFKCVDALEKANGFNGTLNATNVDLTGRNKSITEELIKRQSERDEMNNKYIQEVKEKQICQRDYIDRSKSVNEVFEGIWEVKFDFINPAYKHRNGIEYFKIVNGCEVHTSNVPDGIFALRCYVDRYQFKKNISYTNIDLQIEGKLVNGMEFKKTFVNRGTTTINDTEFATCEYYLINDNKIIGTEKYTGYNAAANENMIAQDVKLIIARHM